MKIIHILNFYDGDIESKKVQERTIESICEAAKVAKNAGISLQFIIVGSALDLEFYSSCYYSNLLEEVSESVSLVKQSDPRSYNFLHGRSNPCLTDTFFANNVKQVVKESVERDNDRLMISNSDICLKPSFYIAIKLLSLNWPFANFAINRETVEHNLLNKSLPDAYNSVGKLHIGHDCFCMTYSSYHKIILFPGSHIIGFGFVMRPLLANLIYDSNDFIELKRSFLTFHYGDDMPWKNDKWNEAIEHNRQGMVAVIRKLRSEVEPLSEHKMLQFSTFFPESIVHD